MTLSKHVEKLDKYYKRLDTGKAQKIKPEHVEKVIRKLKLKEEQLLEEERETQKPSKKERLRRKAEIVLEQKKRAEWLLEQVGETKD